MAHSICKIGLFILMLKYLNVYSPSFVKNMNILLHSFLSRTSTLYCLHPFFMIDPLLNTYISGITFSCERQIYYSTLAPLACHIQHIASKFKSRNNAHVGWVKTILIGVIGDVLLPPKNSFSKYAISLSKRFHQDTPTPCNAGWHLKVKLLG